MAQKMNPPKKDRYPQPVVLTREQKIRNFINTHRKLMISVICAFLALVVIAGIVLAVVLNVNENIPYNIRFKDYIQVPEYVGMHFKNEDLAAEFDEQKRQLLLKYATYDELKEGTVEEGDSVTINAYGYLLKEDGTREEATFESGSLIDYEITDIGNHYTEAGTAFSPEIQEAVIGKDIKNPGDIVVTINYPEDYSVASVKGKTAEFDIVIKKVERPIFPEYNDDFVLAKTGYANVESYETALMNDIRSNLVWNTVINGVKVLKFPVDKVDEYCAEYIEPYNEYMIENELDFNGLLEVMGIDTETFFNNRDAYAYGIVREEMVLYFIARTENISVSDAEYPQVALEVAKKNGYSSVKEFESGVGVDIAERTVIWELVKQFLVESSVFE